MKQDPHGQSGPDRSVGQHRSRFNRYLAVALLGSAVGVWIFGGVIGLLIAAQWLAHELTHLHAAQKLGLVPGWRSLIPLVGAFAGARPDDYGSRENEALVALSGVLAGLVFASVLLAIGAGFRIAAAVTAAKVGFALTAINLLPFRPFDGGRIFPGTLWRYRRDADAAADPASLRFVALCRRLVALVFRDAPDGRPRDTRTVLSDALWIVLFLLLAGLAMIWAVMPPMVFALGMLAGFALVWGFIAALLQLDLNTVLAPAPDTLKPRRAVGNSHPLRPDLPWAGRTTAMASLGIYVAAVSACFAGTLLA